MQRETKKKNPEGREKRGENSRLPKSSKSTDIQPAEQRIQK
jgi:hypothetical protein